MTHPTYLTSDYVRELRILFQVYAQTERDQLTYSAVNGYDEEDLASEENFISYIALAVHALQLLESACQIPMRDLPPAPKI